MENIQYLEILKKAFLSAWQNKFLWLFGFLVFLGGGTSNLNVNGDDIAWLGRKFDFFGQLMARFPNFSTTISLILFLIMIGLFLLRIIGIAAILKGANDPILFSQLSRKAIFSESKNFFSRLLWVELLIGFVLSLIFFALSAPIFYLFSVKAQVLGFFVLFFAILIFLPLIILAYYLRRYANMYVVLGNFQVKMAFDAAYVLFEKNIKKSLIMGGISIFSAISLLIFIILLTLSLMLLLSPFGFLAYWLFAKAGLVGIIVVGITLFISALVVSLSFYQIFLQTAWLYFFQEIALEKEKDVKIMEKVAINAEEMPSVEVG